jgi:hypothetical protein
MPPILVHVAENEALAEILKDVLRRQGIDAAVTGPNGSYRPFPTAWVDVDGGRGHECEVWIADDQQRQQAEAIVREFVSGAREPAGQQWRCPKCGEMIEPQFTACWKCGRGGR